MLFGAHRRRKGPLGMYLRFDISYSGSGHRMVIRSDTHSPRSYEVMVRLDDVDKQLIMFPIVYIPERFVSRVSSEHEIKYLTWCETMCTQ